MTAIRVELQLADGSFTTGMLRAGQSMAQFNQQLISTNPQLARVAANGGNVVRSMRHMDDASRGFLSTLRDLSVVTGAMTMGISAMMRVANGWVGEIVRVNAEMERLGFLMRSMSTKDDPFKDAAESVSYLREQATQMPFHLRTITNGFVKLKATGTDPTAGSLKAIADGVAAFGGGDHEFDRIVLGITQMSGKSVIQMEELRQQLGESMPAAMQLMARSMGVSVAQLTKDISTGTVEAKSSLEAFYAEIERTYGGSAQRMMNTFSGQVSQVYTNLQKLATGEGGDAFFDSIKNQLQDLNQFLRSDMASTIATDMGKGFASMVGYVRTAIGVIWEFRDQLIGVAKIAAGGLGLMALRGAITSMVAVVQGGGLAFQIFSTNMREAVSNIALGASGFKSLGTATTGIQYAAMGAAQGIGAIASGLGAVAPLLTMIGMGAYLLADRFGLLSNKIKDAYDNLVKYGAESRKQAEEVSNAQIKQLETRLARLKESASRTRSGRKSEIEEAAKELAAVRAEQAQLIGDAADREDTKAMDRFTRRMSDEVAGIRARYDQEQIALTEAQQEEIKITGEGAKARSQIDAEYEQKVLASRKSLSENLRAFYKAELDGLKQSLGSADVDQRRQAEKYAMYLRELIVQTDSELRSIDTTALGVGKLSASGDQTKQLERAQTTLDKLKQDVAGLNAEFAGTNGAVAEMNARIAQGDFGTIKEGGDEVRKLHEELLKATEQKELLDKIMDGRRKADADLERARIDLLEKQMEIQEKMAGSDLNPAEKFQLRLNAGYYAGLGPIEKIQKAIVDVVGALDAQGLSSNDVARVMQQNTFGDQTVQHIDSVTMAMQRLVNEIHNVGLGLNGTSFAGFGSDLGTAITTAINPVMQNLPAVVSDRMKQAMDYMMQKGWSKKAAAGIVGNLTVESGMDPNAIGDDGKAFGLAQWNSRGPEMKKFLADQGKAWNDFFGQLDFVDHELRNKERTSGSQVEMAKDVASAADIIMRKYERPADWAMRDSAGKRAGAAQQAYNMSTGGPTVAAAAALPASTVLPTYDATASQERVNTLLVQQKQKTDDLNTAAENLGKEWEKTESQASALERKKTLEKLKADTDAAGKSAGVAGDRYEAMISAIEQGKLGKNKDITAPEYKEILAAAKELDRVNKKIADEKKLTTETDREGKALTEKRLELERSIAEQKKRVNDPTYKADSQALNDLISQLDQFAEKMRQLHGSDSSEYQSALAKKTAMVQQQRTLEVTTTQAALAKERADIEASLMSQSQARQRAMQQDMQQIDNWVAQARKAGWSEVEITEFAEKSKAAIRAKYAAEASPLDKQMKEWGDIQNQLAQGSARWMDSLAGGLTDLIMGTGDLKSVINGIMRDMLNMGIKYMMSGLMGGGSKAGAGKGGGAGKAAASKVATGGKAGGGKLFGAAHTGGIIGSSSLIARRTSPASFINAPKFHSGGIVGSGLLPSEVPIIAKKGEGMFTQEQMANLAPAGGGGQMITIHSPITVNGSAGTPEQNDDLAKKMAKEMETSMRGVVADEVRRQARPGNFLNKR